MRMWESVLDRISLAGDVAGAVLARARLWKLILGMTSRCGVIGPCLFFIVDRGRSLTAGSINPNKFLSLLV